MLKQKVYDWKDTNLALIGSDLDKQARLDSADTERAWDGCGTKPELKVWRIEKFKVRAWPDSKYGKFHSGDAYIVLHTYKESESSPKLKYDIYFWIGDESTQDEYGTAAYKTVELDAKFNDAAVEHREVQYHETVEFKNLFGGEIEYLPGGVETGFNHYEPENMKPELFRVKGTKNNIEFVQVKNRRDQLTSDDVYILDTWLTVYQWNGKNSNSNEKLKATYYLDTVVGARGKDTKKIVLDEGQGDQDCTEFWNQIPDKFTIGCVPIATYSVQEHSKQKDEEVKAFKKKLFKLSEQSNGVLKFSKVTKANGNNKIAKDKLNSRDVFILDDGFLIWVWIGKEATSKEKGQGFNYAMKYITEYKRPAYLPIKQVKEGSEPLTFTENLHNEASSNCIIF